MQEDQIESFLLEKPKLTRYFVNFMIVSYTHWATCLFLFHSLFWSLHYKMSHLTCLVSLSIKTFTLKLGSSFKNCLKWWFWLKSRCIQFPLVCMSFLCLNDESRARCMLCYIPLPSTLSRSAVGVKNTFMDGYPLFMYSCDWPLFFLL